MRIEMRVDGFTPAEALRSFFARRLHCALSLRYDVIERVQVRLSFTDGRPGCDNLCCQLHIDMLDQGSINITDTRSNIYVAIERAVDRAARAMTRQMAPVRDCQRNDGGAAMYASTIL